MATHHPADPQRPARRRSLATSTLRERQLDAYLQTRDTLRRLRALAAVTANVKSHGSPPGAPASPV